MIEIIPAILRKSFKDIERDLERVHGVAPRVQIDVVDGRFAHGATWPYHDRESFEKILAEEEGLPHWQDFDFEFDLMIEDPHLRVMDFVRAGASRVVIHADSHGAVEGLRKVADLREDDGRGAFSVSTGLALLPNMQPDVLDSFDTLYDYVQVMGIDHVGKQGQPFDDHALALIERLRRRYPDLPIQVDGGVSAEHIPALVRAGATSLIVGSAIFGADDAIAAYKALYTEANAPGRGQGS